MASKLPSPQVTVLQTSPRLDSALPTRHPHFAYTSFMQFILLDTADARGSVSIFSGDRLLHLESHSVAEDYSSWILPAVHRCLSNTRLSLAELDGYAACSGPGSFTGLRVGLTTAKAWAAIHGKPTIAVSRLEAIASPASSQEQTALHFVASVFDARRGQAFAALYRRTSDGLVNVDQEQVIAPAAFVEQVMEIAASEAVLWRTPDQALLTSLPTWPQLVAHGHLLEPLHPPFARQLGELAAKKLRQGETKDALSLDAEYVRRSDAEIFWKGNKSAFQP